MTGRFVRAAGGCSAPASKDAAAALAALGQMKVRWYEGEGGASGRREAQVMLRHPNYSGLQRDQMTQLYIPPHFVDTLEVRQGDELLFAMSGGISISEDPTFRFAYEDAGAGELDGQRHRHRGGALRRPLPARHVSPAQKQRISPSAWARRSSSTALLAAGAVRIIPTRSPAVWRMASTVSAAT